MNTDKERKRAEGERESGRVIAKERKNECERKKEKMSVKERKAMKEREEGKRCQCCQRESETNAYRCDIPPQTVTSAKIYVPFGQQFQARFALLKLPRRKWRSFPEKCKREAQSLRRSRSSFTF